MLPSPDLPIVLYHYDASPYARRLVWYLTLRKIPYSQCVSLACLKPLSFPHFLSFPFSPTTPHSPVHYIEKPNPTNQPPDHNLAAPTTHPAASGPRSPGRLVPPDPGPQHRPGRLPRHAPDHPEARDPVPAERRAPGHQRRGGGEPRAHGAGAADLGAHHLGRPLRARDPVSAARRLRERPGVPARPHRAAHRRPRRAGG
ncbi:hypothetical protein F4824DRAFT_445767 [Ustulina deusta]|nr:hypothetical protein F4824DRAFT_445767 [Ustulina deusta]